MSVTLPGFVGGGGIASSSFILFFTCTRYWYSYTGRPGSSEVPRKPLTRWDVSSTPANGIFLAKILKSKNKNARRVEND